MIVLKRWTVDYGRGPKRWFLVNTKRMFCDVSVRAAMRHPIKSARFLFWGIESA